MANEFTDTNVTGTLTVNGVDVTTGVTAGENVARALLAVVGTGATDSGIVGGAAWLKITAQGSPDLTVAVSTGAAFIAGVLTSAAATASLSGFAAPATNPRIDIVQISTAGVVSRKAGSENVSPSAPSADAGNLKLGEVYNRVGQTSVKDADDASNGYITNNGVHL